MDTEILNKELLDAVTFYRIADVKRLLQQGADPNYSGYADQWDDRDHQPWSPLRMVMFRISDSFMTDDSLRAFAEIARLLIQYGAETKPAMEIAEQRYGKYDPAGERDLFLQVWDVVAMADGHNGA